MRSRSIPPLALVIICGLSMLSDMTRSHLRYLRRLCRMHQAFCDFEGRLNSICSQSSARRYVTHVQCSLCSLVFLAFAQASRQRMQGCSLAILALQARVFRPWIINISNTSIIHQLPPAGQVIPRTHKIQLCEMVENVEMELVDQAVEAACSACRPRKSCNPGTPCY